MQWACHFDNFMQQTVCREAMAQLTVRKATAGDVDEVATLLDGTQTPAPGTDGVKASVEAGNVAVATWEV
jgi:hypothetical protein